MAEKTSKVSQVVALRKMEQKLAAGTVLFREDEPSCDLYILIEGEVQITKNGTLLATVNEPGSYLGEMSALLQRPRSATVEVTRPSKLIAVPAAQVEKFFKAAPEMAFKLAILLAQRLEHTNRRLVEHRGSSGAPKKAVLDGGDGTNSPVGD